MSDIGDTYRALKKMRQEESCERRTEAESEFSNACDLADSLGFRLTKKSDSHYQLRGGRWLINLYPGNQRIYADRNQAETAPFLDVPDPWTLEDVVRAASAAANV